MRGSASLRRRGRLIAAALSGAWRDVPPPLPLGPEELAEVTPALLGTGAAALVWRRLRDSAPQPSPPADALQQAYRLQMVQAAVLERRLRRPLRALRAAGLRPLLGKGWAVARHYAEPGLRPYGDFDLYVAAGEQAAARHALRGHAASVDLHDGCAELSDRAWSLLDQRALPVPLGNREVRVFAPEDHLRLLALHMLRHGAWRAVWLCDLGALLESTAGGFDWDRFLSGDPRRTDWACCALVLARELLGADLPGAPARVTRRRLPSWLVPAVLAQWGEVSFQPHGLRRPMARVLRAPVATLRAMQARWPNGIEATVGVRGPFNRLPRLPFQLAECVSRTARFALGLRGVLAR